MILFFYFRHFIVIIFYLRNMFFIIWLTYSFVNDDFSIFTFHNYLSNFRHQSYFPKLRQHRSICLIFLKNKPLITKTYSQNLLNKISFERKIYSFWDISIYFLFLKFILKRVWHHHLDDNSIYYFRFFDKFGFTFNIN